MSRDFGWHITYNYAGDEQPLLPKASVNFTHWHNNSEINPWGGDPGNRVWFGQRSIGDMAFAHISNYKLSNEEFAEQVAERQRLIEERRSATEEGQGGGG